MPALQLGLFSFKNAFCAELLSCPAIAVENDGFMTSQHHSSFDSARAGVKEGPGASPPQ